MAAAASGPPGPLVAISVALNGPAGPCMAITNQSNQQLDLFFFLLIASQNNVANSPPPSVINILSICTLRSVLDMQNQDMDIMKVNVTGSWKTYLVGKKKFQDKAIKVSYQIFFSIPIFIAHFDKATIKLSCSKV